MRKQTGFGLVELMIALVLSLIVVGGLYAALISDKKSYEATRANQLLVNKNRMGMQTMRLYVQQGGFRDFNQLYDKTLMPISGPDMFQLSWDENQILQGVDNTNQFAGVNLKANSDVISLRFFGAEAPNDTIFSCSGDTLAADTVTTINFYVNTNSELVCRDSFGSTIFDTDIDSLQLLYQSAEEGDYKYYKADEVTDWSLINRVKVGLLVAQDVTMGNLQNTNSYQVLDQAITANDKKLRQVVSETILLLNVGA